MEKIGWLSLGVIINYIDKYGIIDIIRRGIILLILAKLGMGCCDGCQV
jgi:hypothetical protein